MTRKAFLIWGLVIIQIFPLTIGLVQYLGFSRLIDINTILSSAILLLFFGLTLAFGVILHPCFKGIGRRKRALLLCIPLYLAFTFLAMTLQLPYHDHVLADSGAATRFYQAIGDWARSGQPGTEMLWSTKQKLDYILVMAPMSYLGQLGLFALLWFGSLDPRNPSKNRLVNALKSRLARASGHPANLTSAA